MLEQPPSLRNGNRDQIRLDTSGYSSLSSFSRMIEESNDYENKSELTNGKKTNQLNPNLTTPLHNETQTNRTHCTNHSIEHQRHTSKHTVQALTRRTNTSPHKNIKNLYNDQHLPQHTLPNNTNKRQTPKMHQEHITQPQN
jgi:hypothetical protein